MHEIGADRDVVDNMVKLPEEITANIISHLSEQQTDCSDDQGSGDSHSRSLAQYAAVSRSWQAHIEAKTFAHITLTPARLASPLAAQALSPTRVHRFVRSVKVDVLLPPYSEDARTRREDREEKLTNDRVFTDVIRKVFALLSSPFPAAQQTMGNLGDDDASNAQQLEQGVSPTAYRPKIKLSMTAVCVSDTEDLDQRRYGQRVNAISTGDIFEARYESSYLDLSPTAGKTVRDEAEGLPELLCVSEFDVQATQAPGRRLFAPRVLCLVASRMPCLRSVNWELCDNEKRDVALRKSLRAGKRIIVFSYVSFSSFLAPSFMNLTPPSIIWPDYPQLIIQGTDKGNRLYGSSENATILTTEFLPPLRQAPSNEPFSSTPKYTRRDRPARRQAKRRPPQALPTTQHF